MKNMSTDTFEENFFIIDVEEEIQDYQSDEELTPIKSLAKRPDEFVPEFSLDLNMEIEKLDLDSLEVKDSDDNHSVYSGYTESDSRCVSSSSVSGFYQKKGLKISSLLSNGWEQNLNVLKKSINDSCDQENLPCPSILQKMCQNAVLNTSTPSTFFKKF